MLNPPYRSPEYGHRQPFAFSGFITAIATSHLPSVPTGVMNGHAPELGAERTHQNP